MIFFPLEKWARIVLKGIRDYNYYYSCAFLLFVPVFKQQKGKKETHDTKRTLTMKYVIPEKPDILYMTSRALLYRANMHMYYWGNHLL